MDQATRGATQQKPSSSPEHGRRRTARPSTSTTTAGAVESGKAESGKPKRRATVTRVAGDRPSSRHSAGPGAGSGSGAGTGSAGTRPAPALTQAGVAQAAKEKRARLWQRRKRMFEQPNAEFAVAVKNGFEGTASPDLLAAMFGSRRADIDRAFDMLEEAITDLPDEVTAHLDVLLQWCAIRMYESSVQGTARVIAVLDALLVMLRASDYTMTDHEAGVFVPFLVEKSGSPKDRFRRGFATLLERLCFVFPASKLVPFLLVGLRSKNNRTRAACVDQLHRIAKDRGWQAVGRKGMRAVAPLVGERDHELRTCALELLQTAWLQHDQSTPALYRMLGSAATDKVQGLMEEKFKFYVPESGAGVGAATRSSPHSTRGSVRSPGRSPRSPVRSARRSAGDVRLSTEQAGRDDFSSPAVSGTRLADESPSPASKLAAAFDRTYNIPTATSPSTPEHAAGFRGRAAAVATPAGVHRPNLFTIADADLAAATPAPSRSQPAAEAGGSFSLHMSEIRDGIEAHDAATEGSIRALGTAGAAGGLTPARDEKGGGTDLRPPSLRRGVSYESEDVPEFVGWVIGGLQGMIQMFNRFMNGPSVTLDMTQDAYVHGGRVMEALFATCTARTKAGGAGAGSGAGSSGAAASEQQEQLDMVVDHANQIIHTLTACLHAAFGKMYAPDEHNRACFDGKEVDAKYLKKICSTFMELFRVEAVARKITPRAMCAILSELTQRLMDPRLANPSKRHEQIIMAINSLALRVSLKARREAMMCGLLRLLQRCVPPGPDADPRFARKPLPEKVMRLTVKLMMKVQKFEERPDTRQKRSGATTPPAHPWEHVECSTILRELHEFFEHHVCFVRDDIPTSAAKAVLLKLVKARGAELASDVAVLPPTSAVHDLFARQMRKLGLGAAQSSSAATRAAASAGPPSQGAATAAPPAPISSTPPAPIVASTGRKIAPPSVPSAETGRDGSKPTAESSGVVGLGVGSGSSKVPPASTMGGPPAPAAAAAAAAATPAVSVEVEEELAAIFAKLSDPKGLLIEGVEDLHRFKMAHPEVDFRPRLAHASEPFRRFILSNLDSMTKRERARTVRGSSSAPSTSGTASNGGSGTRARRGKAQARVGDASRTSGPSLPAAGGSKSAVVASGDGAVAPSAAHSRLAILRRRYLADGSDAAGGETAAGAAASAPGAVPSSGNSSHVSPASRRSRGSSGFGHATSSSGRRPNSGSVGTFSTTASSKASPPGGHEGEALMDATAATNVSGPAAGFVSARSAKLVRKRSPSRGQVDGKSASGVSQLDAIKARMRTMRDGRGSDSKLSAAGADRSRPVASGASPKPTAMPLGSPGGSSPPASSSGKTTRRSRAAAAPSTGASATAAGVPAVTRRARGSATGAAGDSNLQSIKQRMARLRRR